MPIKTRQFMLSGNHNCSVSPHWLRQTKYSKHFQYFTLTRLGQATLVLQESWLLPHSIYIGSRKRCPYSVSGTLQFPGLVTQGLNAVSNDSSDFTKKTSLHGSPWFYLWGVTCRSVHEKVNVTTDVKQETGSVGLKLDVVDCTVKDSSEDPKHISKE